MSGVTDLNVNFKGQIKFPVEEHMETLSGSSLYFTCTLLKGFFPQYQKKNIYVVGTKVHISQIYYTYIIKFSDSRVRLSLGI